MDKWNITGPAPYEISELSVTILDLAIMWMSSRDNHSSEQRITWTWCQSLTSKPDHLASTLCIVQLNIVSTFTLQYLDIVGNFFKKLCSHETYCRSKLSCLLYRLLLTRKKNSERAMLSCYHTWATHRINSFDTSSKHEYVSRISTSLAHTDLSWFDWDITFIHRGIIFIHRGHMIALVYQLGTRNISSWFTNLVHAISHHEMHSCILNLKRSARICLWSNIFHNENTEKVRLLGYHIPPHFSLEMRSLFFFILSQANLTWDTSFVAPKHRIQ